MGSIPAYAGETVDDAKAPVVPWVDPRVRGGDEVEDDAGNPVPGRSPRTRGRPYPQRRGIGRQGSIPAYAGETHERRATLRRQPVDPRVRGGDGCRIGLRLFDSGRSPRTRGRRKSGMAAHKAGRSIPAYAGETPWPFPILHRSQVDPRVRGGDSSACRCAGCTGGRSPRTRGRRSGAGGDGCCIRSIPAYAGETLNPLFPLDESRVDPRVRGGDGQHGNLVGLDQGRSPRTRGRLLRVQADYKP